MKTSIDLLIEARWIIPVEPADALLENHAIAVDKGIIVAISQQPDARRQFSPRQVKQLPHHIVIPGLINLHTHAATTLLRGLGNHPAAHADGQQEQLSPSLDRLASEQFVYDGTRLACAEMLRGGITCFNDLHPHPKAAARAARSFAMRAAIGLISADSASPYATDFDDYLAKGLAARDEFHDDPLLSFCLAPHANDTVDERNLARVLTLSEQCDLPIHLHLHETAEEIERSRQRFGIRPIERLRRQGLLSPSLIAAHAAHLTDEEMRALAENGCSIAHCPSANLKFAGSTPAFGRLLQKNINVGLGTDGAARNNRLDMFQEMRLAALQTQSINNLTPAACARLALHAATLGGALALGLDAQIGSISTGKAADLCAINANTIGMTPYYNPLSLLVYSAGRQHVSDVWIAGLIRLEDGCLLETSEIELIKLAALWQNQICPRNV